MRLKQVPEDFIVKERISLDLKKGDFVYFKLTKREWNTFDAVKKIADALKVDLKNFGFAGNKDKNAITEQVISVQKISKESLKNLRLKDMEVEVLGTGNGRISLGDLDGNDFVVTVRDVEEFEIKEMKIKNYFDEQRFGTEKKNHFIGKAIVKKEFVKACELLHLEVKNNEHINTLRSIGRRMLRFYIHAYQSYLFNEALKVLDREKLPVPGFLTKFTDEEVKKVYLELLEKDGIILKDFIINSMKEISSEGNERDCYIDVKNLEFKWEDDELNFGKRKAILSFSLGKGQYATAVVKALFNQSIIN